MKDTNLRSILDIVELLFSNHHLHHTDKKALASWLLLLE
jgi:hypothetical protein